MSTPTTKSTTVSFVKAKAGMAVRQAIGCGEYAIVDEVMLHKWTTKLAAEYDADIAMLQEQLNTLQQYRAMMRRAVEEWEHGAVYKGTEQSLRASQRVAAALAKAKQLRREAAHLAKENPGDDEAQELLQDAAQHVKEQYAKLDSLSKHRVKHTKAETEKRDAKHKAALEAKHQRKAEKVERRRGQAMQLLGDEDFVALLAGLVTQAMDKETVAVAKPTTKPTPKDEAKANEWPESCGTKVDPAALKALHAAMDDLALAREDGDAELIAYCQQQVDQCWKAV